MLIPTEIVDEAEKLAEQIYGDSDSVVLSDTEVAVISDGECSILIEERE